MSEVERQLLISVIGRGDDASDRAKELAAEVGRLLARRGATVVCGGLGGVMEAACKGAKSAGGTTIGILPGSDPDAATNGGDDASDRAKELAAEVGRLLARRGATVVCGGLGGVMEAACKGAKSAGGTTIGILPGSDPDAANKWVDIPIPTGLGYARNTIVVKAGAAVIAVSGAYGTLSEIGHSLAEDKAVVGLETWDLNPPDGTNDKIIRAANPEDAVEKAMIYRSSGAVCRACPAFGVCTRNKRHGRALEISPHDAALRRHRAWMSTEQAKQAYRQRKQLVEPVFGIIKEQQHARRFLLRGLPNVAAEWTLLATAFNLRTLWRVRRAAATWKRRRAAVAGAFSAYRAAQAALMGQPAPCFD